MGYYKFIKTGNKIVQFIADILIILLCIVSIIWLRSDCFGSCKGTVGYYAIPVFIFYLIVIPPIIIRFVFKLFKWASSKSSPK